MSIPRFNDRHCTSVLDEAAPSLTLRVKASLYSYREFAENQEDCRPGSDSNVLVTYRCAEATDEILRNVKAKFRDAIADHWNEKLVLVDYIRGARTRQVSCRVEVEFENSYNAATHLRICLLVDPHLTRAVVRGAPAGLPPTDPDRLGFRSSCSLGGTAADQDPDGSQFDMFLAWRTSGQNWSRRREVVSSDQGLVPLRQNTVAHEFGHYLGLQHACYVDGATSTDRCSLDEYCEGSTRQQLANMMAVGSEHTGDHARPWLERLVTHEYMRHITWSGVVL